MQRTVELSIPADTDPHSLWDLFQDVNDLTAEDEIFPDRCCALSIIFKGAVTMGDRDVATNGGQVYANTDVFIRNTQGNTICFKDWYFIGSGVEMQVNVEFK